MTFKKNENLTSLRERLKNKNNFLTFLGSYEAIFLKDKKDGELNDLDRFEKQFIEDYRLDDESNTLKHKNIDDVLDWIEKKPMCRVAKNTAISLAHKFDSYCFGGY